ncbi:MAG: 4-hydroxy-tetrahydrodipicolinate reductase [Actinomycetota bacterium]|nr:4-hydroxy-tetrahydrodipicolinate reductase [Actinomycetota bacterium]
MIRVVVCGASGKMGRTVCKAVHSDPELSLVGAVDKDYEASGIQDLSEMGENKVYLDSSLSAAIKELKPDVVVDFTNPDVVMNNIKIAVELEVDMVIGTTGFTSDKLGEVERIIDGQDVGIFIAPNFAIGAVLMMKFAEKAAKYFNDAEIIELHHNEKYDAPSGTAMKTAEMLSSIKTFEDLGPNEKEILPGSRGGNYKNIRIHSIRLPGLIGHQEVLFGLDGQLLTIRHDTLDRSSFMPGVLMAIKKHKENRGVTVGLDKLMEI